MGFDLLFCNRDQRRAQHAVVQDVALLHDGDDGVRVSLGLDRGHRLVAVRVEALAGRGVDLADARFLERRAQLLERELDAAGIAGLDGGLEAVDHREQALGEALQRVFA